MSEPGTPKPDYAESFKKNMQAIVAEWSDQEFTEHAMIRDLHIENAAMGYVVRTVSCMLGWFVPADVVGAMSVKEIMDEIRRKDDVFYLM